MMERVLDLPLNKAEMILLRVFVQAYVATAHEKPHLRARAYLRRAEALLQAEANWASAVPIRPDDREAAAERRRAREIFNHLAPLFVAALPPD